MKLRKKSKKEGYGISNKNVKNHLSFIINARLTGSRV